MIHRFRKIRDATKEEGLIAGDSGLSIQAYGKIDIFIDAPEGSSIAASGKWKVILTNVCCISNFMTKLIAARLLRLKGVFFDDQRMYLHHGGNKLGLVRHLHRHDVLEDNIPPQVRETSTEGPQLQLY